MTLQRSGDIKLYRNSKWWRYTVIQIPAVKYGRIALVLLAAANVTCLVKFINKPISPQPGRGCDGAAAPVGWGESRSNRGLF